MAPDGSSLHPRLPPSPCSPISSSPRFKDEGEWAGGRGEGGARTVGRDESRVVVEVSLAQHSCFHPSTLTTPTPPSPPKNTLFLLAALFHPIIPLLLHCICFLIRSVWEAHEPFLQPLHRHHLHLLFLLLLHSPFSRVAVMLLVFLCVAPVISSVIPPYPRAAFSKSFSFVESLSLSWIYVHFF